MSLLKIFLLLHVMIFAVLLPVKAGELEPYCPTPAKIRKLGTAIKLSEIQIPLRGGIIVEPGKAASCRSLNGEWKFSGLECSLRPFRPGTQAEWGKVEYDDSKWQTVKVPENFYWYHDATGKPYYNSFVREKSCYRGGYRKEISFSKEDLCSKRILLRFNTIGYAAMLYVNGQEAGEHHGDFTPWEVDITPWVKPGRNLIALEVCSDFGARQGNLDKISHVYGSQFNKYNIKGGIWRDVELRIEPELRISRLLVNPLLARQAVELDYTILNPRNQPAAIELAAAVTDAIKGYAANRIEGELPLRKMTLEPGENRGTVIIPLKNPVEWSPENPYLYFATLYLQEDGGASSARAERFGYREFVRENGNFFLNKKKIYLFGESLSIANVTKKEHIQKKLIQMRQYGINCVRTAHQPAASEFYEMADELGMMVNNEWGWSFDYQLDYPAFEKNNLAEIQKWVERDYNHPSVVIWSGGNEVNHKDSKVGEQLDKQVRLIRLLDGQNRPVGSFSGSASLSAYGFDRRDTDFLDLHDYVGGTRGGAWTRWPQNVESRRMDLEKSYGTKYFEKYPVIFWENIGFGWGWSRKSDPKFSLSDIGAYYKYASETTTSWESPNGIGFAGSIGLARALSRDGQTYAQNIYGKRMYELFRRDPQFTGIASGWSQNLQAGMTLWNQPVLIILSRQNQFPPRNLWSGRRTELELTLLNHSGEAIPRGEITITILSERSPREILLGTIPIPAVDHFGRFECPIEFTIPDQIDGHAQIRLTGRAGDIEFSRNYYDIFVQPHTLVKTQLRSFVGRIAVLDTGIRADCEAFAARLSGLGLNAELIGIKDSLAGFQVAIVPPSERGITLAPDNRHSLLQWVNNGGRLLILEQSGDGWLDKFRLMYSTFRPSPFVDLIYPEHPVFAGLDQRNFDTWENSQNGAVIEGLISPFSRNSIASRPPLIGETSTRSAIIEATYGKGNIFWSQLVANKLWDIDSSATRYLVNLLGYMTGNKLFEKISPLDVTAAQANYDVSPGAKLLQLDLTKHVNRGFIDEVAGDGRGGWTDQGANDMRNLPIGEQLAAGIRFQIVDPAQNGGNGCIALAGDHNKEFAGEVVGIPVNAKLARLFFLHTAGYIGNSAFAGRYIIRYRDGSHIDFDICPGKNIGDWWSCEFLPQAKLGLLASNPMNSQVGTYVAEWVNPYPDKDISSVDILSAETARRQNIDWLPGPTPTTFVIAITGEIHRDFRIDIDTAVSPANWGTRGNTQKGQPPVRLTFSEHPMPDATRKRVVRLEFPEGNASSCPVAATRFPIPPQFDPGRIEYISFDLRAETTGEISIVLPAKGWKASCRVRLPLDGSNQWRRIRLALPAEQQQAISGKELLGEIWFYNNPIWLGKTIAPPVTFQIADIVLE